jgi:hypothetical protein
MRHKRLLWIDGPVIAALCVLSLAFYRHITLSNRILSGVDAFTYFYPYRAYAAQVIRSGHVPLWNPYLFTGVPFLANSQAAVFYPLNLVLDAAAVTAPKLLAWSIVMHTALAAGFAYLYARISLRLSPLPATLGATVFAFGGYLSGQVEHINQLNVLVWFPLLLLLWDLRQRARWLTLLGIGATIGLGLLAGHAQSSYITLLGLSVYALLPALASLVAALFRKAPRAAREDTSPGGARIARSLPLRHAGCVVLDLAMVCLIGAGLAAVQLLPTLELSRLSIRGGGLTYREAVAFSLQPLPRLLRFTFLPPWGRNLADVYGGSQFTEYLAYVGVLPLLLAGGWLVFSLLNVARGNTPLHEEIWARQSVRLLVLSGLGLALALGLYNPLYLVLYKVVPGFALFRVPARWLFLYAYGIAMIAALGTQRLYDWLASRLATSALLRWCQPLLILVALEELFSASTALPFTHPTAPEAYSSLRTAPAHILAAQHQAVAPGRFLSMSDMLFDPGDLAEMQLMFRGQLSPQALYDYVVCAKRKEILAPNLPLAWRIYAVDGYDGGLLPLARYITLQRLLLDESDILPDGRLREGLTRIPPSRLLSILGTQYVITDKVHDVWIDDVFYDLGFDAVLATGGTPSIASTDLPRYVATGVGIVSYLEGARTVPDGTPVAEVRLDTAGGSVLTFVLRAGQDTAEGRYDADVQHAQARIGPGMPNPQPGFDYITRLGWETPADIVRIQVSALPFPGQIHIHGLSLVDVRDGSNVPLVLSTDGQFRQVHSGDVKIYEVLDALPRAYVVHRAYVLDDDEAALAAMADPGFDPAQEVILAGGQPLSPDLSAASRADVVAYEPERVTVEVSAGAPGYLVLSDAWYPGWVAAVDGQPASIERANLHFRAIYLPPGAHTVQLTYRPLTYILGLAISLASLVAFAAAAVVSLLHLPTASDWSMIAP